MEVKRRRSYLVNKTFQFRMIIVSFIITGPIIAIFSFTYSYFINGLLDKLEFMDKEVALSLINFIGETERNMKMIILAGTFIIVAFNSIFFLFLSHAIAGPIEKLKAHLVRKANNEVTGPFMTRNTDFFPELPGIVNKVFKDELPQDKPEAN